MMSNQSTYMSVLRYHNPSLPTAHGETLHHIVYYYPPPPSQQPMMKHIITLCTITPPPSLPPTAHDETIINSHIVGWCLSKNIMYDINKQL